MALSILDVIACLDAHGVDELDNDRGAVGFEVRSEPDTWIYPGTCCPYSRSVIPTWRTDRPLNGAKHPHTVGKLVRLALMRRRGRCIDAATEAHALRNIADRHAELCAGIRPVGLMEIESAWDWAINYVACMTEEQFMAKVKTDLGGHEHAPAPVLSLADTNGAAGCSGPGIPHLVELEQDFWQAYPQLQTIYTVSLKRMCSPWAVLGCCVARVLAQIPPHILLPDVFGEWGSLNWFGAIAGASGRGKGNANGLARRLAGEVPHTHNLGSGEGMTDVFWHVDKDDKGKRTIHRIHQVMFNANEIDNLAALGDRSGSTLMPTLREAFSGGELGFTNRKNANTLPAVGAQTYRLTFLCSVQPGRARAILGDADGGTPQRFMWLPAVDPRRTAREYDRGYPVAELILPSASAWQYRTEITIPKTVEWEIVIAQEDTADADALDGHAMYAREKFAFALAVIGHPEAFIGKGAAITEEDWRLSGIAANVSTATRDWVQAGMAEAERAAVRVAGDLYGERMAAADVARAGANLQRDARIGKNIVKYLKAAGAEGLTDLDLHHKIAGRDKAFWRAVAGILVQQGDIAHAAAASGKRTEDIWQWAG